MSIDKVAIVAAQQWEYDFDETTQVDSLIDIPLQHLPYRAEMFPSTRSLQFSFYEIPK